MSFVLPPGFVPSLLSPAQVLFLYFSAVCVILLPAWHFTGRVQALGKGERWLACGMLALGLNHLVVEAYFFFTPRFYQTSSATLLPEIWKLYGLADSRYLTRNPTIMGIEGVLVLILGPMALLCMYGIMAKKTWLHPLLLVYCSTEIMLTINMFMSSAFEEKSHAVDLFHFWFYYVFFSILYGFLVPFLIGITSMKKINDIVYLYNKSPSLQKPMKALN